MFVDILKFVCSSAKLVRTMRRLQFIGFYSGSDTGGGGDVKFMFW